MGIEERPEFLPGEVLPEQMPIRGRRLFPEGATAEEKAEIIGNRIMAKATDRERQADLKNIFGKTEAQLEADADVLLRAAGFNDLVEGKDI